MLDFTRNGKRYVAGRGFFAVFNQVTGEKEESAIEVFRDTDPTPEDVMELHNSIIEFRKKQNEKPRQTKVITKDPF